MRGIFQTLRINFSVRDRERAAALSSIFGQFWSAKSIEPHYLGRALERLRHALEDWTAGAPLDVAALESFADLTQWQEASGFFYLSFALKSRAELSSHRIVRLMLDLHFPQDVYAVVSDETTGRTHVIDLRTADARRAVPA